ncbi:hypothetical protein UY3_11213 [Chelonia mydas]|uniref:Uncharacterized protein n=1 Tax=Chelonia mydas TaxID=8469 RepID=M7B3J4_CHEMY|nr:hypothetical protein UY3_11213 [Chelonia mydas]
METKMQPEVPVKLTLERRPQACVTLTDPWLSAGLPSSSELYGDILNSTLQSPGQKSKKQLSNLFVFASECNAGERFWTGSPGVGHRQNGTTQGVMNGMGSLLGRGGSSVPVAWARFDRSAQTTNESADEFG